MLAIHPTGTIGKSLKVWFGVALLHTATSNCSYEHINTPLMQGHASSHGNGKQVGVRQVDARTEEHGRWHQRERLVSVQLSTTATGPLFYSLFDCSAEMEVTHYLQGKVDYSHNSPEESAAA